MPGALPSAQPSSMTLTETASGCPAWTRATSIVVTHDRALAFNLADRVAMIFDGQILFVGTPDDRAAALSWIWRALRPGGVFAL